MATVQTRTESIIRGRAIDLRPCCAFGWAPFENGVVVEPFRIHVTDEVLDDLRARLRHTRWPDQVPGIGWKQGTALDWLQHVVSYWANKFDWPAWEKRLNTLDHFMWEGIHFVYRRAASGRSARLSTQKSLLNGRGANNRHRGMIRRTSIFDILARIAFPLVRFDRYFLVSFPCPSA